MDEEPLKTRRARALAVGALLVVVAALWVGRSLWMIGLDPSPPAAIASDLDLARALRFGILRANDAGAKPRSVDQRVIVPPGSAVAWTVRLPSPTGGLAAAAIELEPGARASIHVGDEAGVQRLISLEGCAADCRFPLDDFAGRIVRIAARGPAPGRGPLVLVEPSLYGPAPTSSSGAAFDAPRPPIILYLVDTLRADKLGAYGSDRGLTPEIDAFAEGATVFEETLAQAPWTKPSVASIFTGLYARVHRIMTRQSALPDSAMTLAELLGLNGYRTGAVVTNGLVDADFGFDQGFEYFVRERGRAPEVEGITGFQADKPAIDSDIAQAAVWPWLDAIEPDQPFFLYVHVLDPHSPHFPPDPFRARFVPELDRFDLGSMESIRQMDERTGAGEPPPPREQAQLETLYEAEIAHNDHQFGLFIDELRERGLYDEALIVLVSDHGEAFWEHGLRGHGKTLHEELLHVPLIVKAPHQTTAARVRSLAQHVDLLPTFTDYAGIAPPGAINGRSLRPLIEDGDAAEPSEVSPIGVSAGTFGTGVGTAIREGRWKLIKRQRPTNSVELFDLEADPAESRDVSGEHPLVTRYLLEKAARIEADTAAPWASTEREITPQKAAELKALGYIE